MPEKPAADEMQDLWRSQQTEPPRISLQQLQHKAQKLRKKSKREICTLYAVAIVLVVAFLFGLTATQGAVQRIGLGILIIWALLTPARAQKKLLQERLSADAALAPCIAFYRRQLERHRDYQRHIWLWLASMFLGIGLYLSPAIAGIVRDLGRAPKILPFCTLLVIWTAAFFYLRRRRLRKLSRKLEDLSEIEKEIQS